MGLFADSCLARDAIARRGTDASRLNTRVATRDRGPRLIPSLNITSAKALTIIKSRPATAEEIQAEKEGRLNRKPDESGVFLECASPPPFN